MIDSDSACDLFKHYNIDCLMEIMFIATLREYRGKGIGKTLIESSMMLAQELNEGNNVKVSIDGSELEIEPIPKLVSAISTSFITQKIVKSLGFKRIVEISYEDFMFKGKTYASKLDNKTSCTTLDSYKL